MSTLEGAQTEDVFAPPGPHLSDYRNEYAVWQQHLERELKIRGHERMPHQTHLAFYASIDPAVFAQTLAAVQAHKVMRTVEERFAQRAAVPGGASKDEEEAELARFPGKVRRLDEIAHILNTSVDQRTVTAAFDEGLRLLGEEVYFARAA